MSNIDPIYTSCLCIKCKVHRSNGWSRYCITILSSLKFPGQVAFELSLDKKMDEQSDYFWAPASLRQGSYEQADTQVILNSSVHVKNSVQTSFCSICIGSACTSWSFGSSHCNSLSSWFSWKYFTPVYRLTWPYSI